MIHIALQELADVPYWETLLATYRERQLQEMAAHPEEDGWVPRIRSLDEVDKEQLSHLHGRLIALGFLKFELGGRTSGMSYQVSTLGVRALSGSPADATDAPLGAEFTASHDIDPDENLSQAA